MPSKEMSVLGHPGLSAPTPAKGHTACWGYTEAQETSASPTELAVPSLLQLPGVSGQYGQRVVGGGCPRAGNPPENSVWMLQLLQASSLLKSLASFCHCSPQPTPPHPTLTPCRWRTGPKEQGLVRDLGVVPCQARAPSVSDLCLLYQCRESQCISTCVYSWTRRAPKEPPSCDSPHFLLANQLPSL